MPCPAEFVIRDCTIDEQNRLTWASSQSATGPCGATLLGDEMSTLVQEQLRVVLLDTKNHVLACELVYQGTLHSIAIRAAEVLRPAVLVTGDSPKRYFCFQSDHVTISLAQRHDAGQLRGVPLGLPASAAVLRREGVRVDACLGPSRTR